MFSKISFAIVSALALSGMVSAVLPGTQGGRTEVEKPTCIKTMDDFKVAYEAQCPKFKDDDITLDFSNVYFNDQAGSQAAKPNTALVTCSYTVNGNERDRVYFNQEVADALCDHDIAA
ncbi:uncharacterized protein L201_005184 [Kwoniella dendrophila CBS 6074]|uniref:Secreted protein n=1 Tax=Kwoniella dendrophila CBS 6074 TaxID=1295534 RepID=A0AAX4JXQ4_9TREE